MADTSVKYFHSAMIGAPVLNGTSGSLIAVLDACLVNGFGLGTLDSLVISGGIATATRAGGHSQEANSVVLISGATITGGFNVNGSQKVLSATTTTFTFDATGIVNQTATGTITAKLAAAGWSKGYSGTNLGAYVSSDFAANPCIVRVDDTGAQTARVVGYEVMSDINTGTGQFPTTAQQSGGLHWTKSSSANATANAWMLIADKRFFYFARAYRSGNAAAPNEYQLHVFGDVLPTKTSADPYASIISGETTDQSGSNVQTANNYYSGAASTAAGLFMPRSYTGLGSSIAMGKSYPTLNGNTGGPSGTQGTPFPNPTDGGLYAVPHYVFEAPNGSSFNIHRGISPGFYCVPMAVTNGQFATRDNVVGVTGLAGKTLKALTGVNGTFGVSLIDITGPWR